jgi:hypothetical protein
MCPVRLVTYVSGRSFSIPGNRPLFLALSVALAAWRKLRIKDCPRRFRHDIACQWRNSACQWEEAALLACVQ